ncbi:hypothetical protein ACOJQI_11285 [Bacillus salacetis]|uniref:hypothetical protein n=1 Tax=Bacillus salacetis TaxID=2315464 RepID=UPI003B9EEA48
MRLKLLFFILLVLVTACSKEQTFEEFFQEKMKENEKEYSEDVDYSYSLVHQDQNIVTEDDAIAIFTENNLQGKQIFIAYIKKENGHWAWQRTRGAEWDAPQKWSAMDKVPYIYSGAMRDNSITEVYAGREKATIVDVEGDKRFWYVVSPAKEVKVRYVRKDGTEEIVDQLDEEMLEEQARKKK